MDGGFVFILMIVIVVIAISVHQSKKTDEAWSVAARALHLLHHPGGFMQQRRLTGKIDGCQVVIETITRGSGKNSRNYTRYSVAYPGPLRLGLSLRKQGFLSGVAKAFGAQDIHVGDATFDSLVMVKGTDPAAVAGFLTPDRRGLILRAMAQFDDLEINDAGIQTESSGHESSFQMLIRKTQRLVEFARIMSDVGGTSSRSEEPTAAPAPIRKQKWNPKPKPEPDPAPPPNPEPLPEPQPVVASVLKPEPASAGGIPLNASEVGGTLFAGHHGIAEIERRFAAEHANRRITGHGILRNWKATSFDFVFGTEPCVKATLDVPLPDAGSHGRSTFQVVLRLPAGTESPVIGEGFSFEGRILKVDGLMRQLFVRSE